MRQRTKTDSTQTILLSSRLTKKHHWIILAIDRLRVERSLTGKALSEMAGLTSNNYNFYLGPRSSLLSLRTIEKFLDVLGYKLLIVPIKTRFDMVDQLETFCDNEVE